MTLYSWIVLGHVVSVILAFAAHGVSAFAIFRVRTERDRTRLAAILDLSAMSLGVAAVFLLLAIIFGIVAAIMGGHFARAWPWVSIVLLVVVIGSMTPLAAGPMRAVREALGMSTTKPGETPIVPASDEALAAAQAAIRPEIPMVIGVVAIILLSWMMRAKPF